MFFTMGTKGLAWRVRVPWTLDTGWNAYATLTGARSMTGCPIGRLYRQPGGCAL